MQTNEIARLLEDILGQERRLILSGRIPELSQLAPRKEALIGAIASLQDTRTLARLRGAAERNDVLLASASRGIQAALDRVREIRSHAGTLQTYTPDGLRSCVSTVSGSLERRA
jgi:flagellar biosynthesis/type III secretory pathway chaperone